MYRSSGGGTGRRRSHIEQHKVRTRGEGGARLVCLTKVEYVSIDMERLRFVLDWKSLQVVESANMDSKGAGAGAGAVS